MLEGRKVDLVLSDMAPTLSGVGLADAARMGHLAELALEFALRHLKPDGALLIKCFHGSGYSQIVEAFKDGWVQLTSDQQPFLQGYMPVLSLCQQVVYGLGAINVDTGAGFVTPDNYAAVADLAKEGLR